MMDNVLAWNYHEINVKYKNKSIKRYIYIQYIYILRNIKESLIMSAYLAVIGCCWKQPMTALSRSQRLLSALVLCWLDYTFRLGILLDFRAIV